MICFFSCKKDAAPTAGVIPAISNTGTVGNTSVGVTVLSGDVKLGTQADVNSFASKTGGQQVQITGSLVIGALGNTTTDISSVAGLSNITAVSGEIIIENTPLLTDAAFLGKLTNVTYLSILNSGLTSLKMDSLTSVTRDA